VKQSTVVHGMDHSTPLSAYFGFDPNSPYADLFSQIYLLTKVNNNQDISSDHEDGEIIEKDNESFSIEDNDDTDTSNEAGAVSADEVDGNLQQLSGDFDFKPQVDLVQNANDQTWKDGWMKISRDAISWNQISNQNEFKPTWINQPPPPPHPPPPFRPFSLSGGTNHNNGFKGTNQVNSSIFTMNNDEKQIDFSLPPPPPPPPIQSMWNQNGNANYLPFASQGMSILGVPSASANGFPLPVPTSRENEYSRQEEKDTLDFKSFDLRVQFDMDDNPLRKNWLLKFMDFQANRGTPLLNCPAFHKEPLDLFKLYHAVIEEGGFANCSVKKAWIKVCTKIYPRSPNKKFWRILQKQYRKLLLHYENFELGRPEDLSMKTDQENGDVKVNERKVLLPLPDCGAVGMSFQGHHQMQWDNSGFQMANQRGPVDMPYNYDITEQETSRGGKRGKKGSKVYNKVPRRN